MSEEKKILKNVNKLLAQQEFKNGMESIRSQVTEFVGYHQTVFLAMKEKGYSSEQAFKFASDATLKLMFYNPNSTTKEDDEY